MDGIRTEEIGDYLNREGIAVRAGHHCAQPIHRRFGIESTVRASLALYNTCEDIDALVAALQRLQVGAAPPRLMKGRASAADTGPTDRAPDGVLCSRGRDQSRGRQEPALQARHRRYHGRSAALAVSRVLRRNADPLLRNRSRHHRASRKRAGPSGKRDREEPGIRPARRVRGRRPARYGAHAHPQVPGQPAASSRTAPDRYGGGLQRRPRRVQQGRSDRRVSLHRSHCGAAAGARTVSRQHPAHSAYHDRMGARPHRNGSPSRGPHRHAFLRGSLHRDGGGRDRR